jgi:hypothetical protein
MTRNTGEGRSLKMTLTSLKAWRRNTQKSWQRKNGKEKHMPKRVDAEDGYDTTPQGLESSYLNEISSRRTSSA